MYIFIINRIAGGGRAVQVFNMIKNHPLYHQVKCRSYVTEYEGHAEKLAQQVASIYSESITCFVVIGGDGTVHECVNGLKHFPTIPISCIAAGSGNDFVRGYGLSGDPVEVFRRIVEHHNKDYWPGNFWTDSKRERNRRLFVNSISFGFDAEITQTANHSTYKKRLNKWKIGSISYVIALFQVLRRYKPLTVELEIDGKRQLFENVLMVTISNQPYYGGGMKINPSARIRPVSLSTLIIKNLSAWKIPFLFVSVFFGWHVHLKEVSVMQGNKIKLESKNTIVYQVDGQTGKCEICQVSKEEQARNIRGGK
ncbi:diacylglycerol/lipid kinase family protein [Bacillus pinisoli]|uniref:diacylglycerol/lipid kinase family protein n=1 Tax=Bacillus pinisoli TaxID=2901866 RepID=UPI001FF544A6|nr:YegS/Rv2252/BmrU family lipid kinase [Bacillus pinisoli]